MEGKGKENRGECQVRREDKERKQARKRRVNWPRWRSEESDQIAWPKSKHLCFVIVYCFLFVLVGSIALLDRKEETQQCHRSSPPPFLRGLSLGKIFQRPVWVKTKGTASLEKESQTKKMRVPLHSPKHVHFAFSFSRNSNNFRSCSTRSLSNSNFCCACNRANSSSAILDLGSISAVDD